MEKPKICIGPGRDSHNARILYTVCYYRCSVGAGGASGVNGVAVLRQRANPTAAVEGEVHAVRGALADVLAVDHVSRDLACKGYALASTLAGDK